MPTEVSGSFWWGIWLRKLERAKITPPPDWLEDQVPVQKMFCDSRVTITNTGQRNHQPDCAAVCVLLVAKERAQCISVPDVMWACAWCLLSRNITPKQIFNISPSLWILCVMLNSDPRCHRPSEATRVMWVMNCLHHILYNACNSQALIYYKNRWIFLPGLTNS